MTSCGIFSQNITRDSVTIVKTTLISIYKDMQKCDSLKVAYVSKSNELDNLIVTNLSIFKELDSERTKRLKYEAELEKATKELLKQTKKTNNSLFWAGGAGVTGLIIGVLINK